MCTFRKGRHPFTNVDNEKTDLAWLLIHTSHLFLTLQQGYVIPIGPEPAFVRALVLLIDGASGYFYTNSFGCLGV